MVVLLVAVPVAGCGGGESVEPVLPSPTPSAAPTAVSPPDDGITLSVFGYTNGPIKEFSLPRTTVPTVIVDQPNNVSMVISTPPAADLYAYLDRALPAAGFLITAHDPATTTLTFSGHGWTGSFTGAAQASAVLLRPS